MTEYAGTGSAKDKSTLRDDVDKTASIRILDPNIVSPTFQQLQQIRNYYTFPNNLDVDRYSKNGKVQDTVIGLRELNLDGIPKKNWINNHFRYTHGYGVVAAKGTEADGNGQPVFTESDLPSSGELPTYEQRIYYGEKTTTYSIVGGPQKEIDYSDNDGEKTTSYREKSGVSSPARSTGRRTRWRSASRRSSTRARSARARGSCTTARPRSASRPSPPG